MSTTQLLENLHQKGDGQLEKVMTLISKIDKEMTVMIKVISSCATAPHRLITKVSNTECSTGVIQHISETCLPTCPTCIAKRFMANQLTKDDYALLGVKK